MHGKTTILRDLIRNLSNGTDEFQGINIGVVDERGELAATYRGIAQNDLGIRTDILDNMPKAIGIKMLVRSMAPKVVVADEIGSKEDVEAIKEAMCFGVKGIFTAHGKDIEDIENNRNLRELLDYFEKIIVLNPYGQRGEILNIYSV